MKHVNIAAHSLVLLLVYYTYKMLVEDEENDFDGFDFTPGYGVCVSVSVCAVVAMF